MNSHMHPVSGTGVYIASCIHGRSELRLLLAVQLYTTMQQVQLLSNSVSPCCREPWKVLLPSTTARGPVCPLVHAPSWHLLCSPSHPRCLPAGEMKTDASRLPPNVAVDTHVCKLVASSLGGAATLLAASLLAGAGRTWGMLRAGKSADDIMREQEDLLDQV